MKRLTERWCAGGIRIKGCSTLYQDVERKSAPMASAIARLAAYEDAMPLERAQELAQVEKDGWPPVTPGEKTCDAHTAEAEYLLVVLWNGLHNAYGMDAKVADRVAEIAHEGDKVQPDTTPKNDPLTLEELREMDGEPVWVCTPENPFDGCYGVVRTNQHWEIENWFVATVSDTMFFAAYGKTWIAYRRRPENDHCIGFEWRGPEKGGAT